MQDNLKEKNRLFCDKIEQIDQPFLLSTLLRDHRNYV